MPLLVKSAYQDIDKVKLLFKEYTDFLGIDLGFQNYDEEFRNLPGDYGPPSGRLYIAEYDGQLAGCIAMHPYGDAGCEMKRLYVRPEFRGKGIASALIGKIVSDAGDLGYQSIVLDTLPFLHDSIALYRKLGFYEIEPYRFNPVEGSLYFRLDI